MGRCEGGGVNEREGSGTDDARFQAIIEAGGGKE